MGGRLAQFHNHWPSVTLDVWVLSVLKRGLFLSFLSPPPLSPFPVHLSQNHPEMKTVLLSLLEKRAIERVLNPNSPGFYSRVFLVPKKTNNSWRPVIDLSILNTLIPKEHFQMETTASVRAAIRPGDWAVSIDLSDAYFHILIHPSSRKFLRFTDGHTVYQFRALPFGLSSAPRVFTRVMAALASHFRVQGIRIIQYLDDWLILNTDRFSLVRELSLVSQTVLRLGLLINPEKSEFIPSQDFTFIGMRFQTQCNILRLPDSRITSLLNLVHIFLRCKRVRARQLLSLLGVLSSASDMIPLGRLHLRPLQMLTLHYWRPHSDLLSAMVPLPPLFHQHLTWWIQPGILTGVPISKPQPSLFLFTDASLEGWGAHLEPLGLLCSGVWDPSHPLPHINILEMKAVFLALREFLPHLQNQSVMLSTDNSTVVAYILKQGGTHSPSLCLLAWQLLLFCQDKNILLSVRHLPGRLNVIADKLSRSSRPLLAEWSLSMEVLLPIFNLWGRPMVDLFATRWNNRLPLFVSPILDPSAWAVDALSLRWDNLIAYVFPPFNMIPEVLDKLLSSTRCSAILIAPRWPQRSWFPTLLDLLIDHPIPLPIRPDLLSQGRRKILHNNPAILHLHAWRLSSVESLRRSFRQRLPLWSPEPEEDPLLKSTMPNGSSSIIGVVDGRSILPNHLFPT